MSARLGDLTLECKSRRQAQRAARVITVGNNPPGARPSAVGEPKTVSTESRRKRRAPESQVQIAGLQHGLQQGSRPVFTGILARRRAGVALLWRIETAVRPRPGPRVREAS